MVGRWTFLLKKVPLQGDMLGFLEAPTILVTLIRHDQMPKAEPHAPQALIGRAGAGVEEITTMFLESWRAKSGLRRVVLLITYSGRWSKNWGIRLYRWNFGNPERDSDLNLFEALYYAPIWLLFPKGNFFGWKMARRGHLKGDLELASRQLTYSTCRLTETTSSNIPWAFWLGSDHI